MSMEDEVRSAAHSRWIARGQPENDSWQDWFAAERRIDRRFYHSFPRSGRGTASEISNGLAILDQMVRYGLLLTPETHRIIQTLDNPPRRQTAWLVQQRLCLTELNPSEVPWHAVDFGRFSLEFDVAAAREIGAVPALYYNQSTPGESGTWFLSQLLSQICFVRHKLLWQLIAIEDQVKEAGDNSDAPVSIGPDVTISAGQGRALLQFLETSGDFDLHQIEAVLRLCSCIWSPAENLQYNSLLGYYRQREWRIVPGPLRTGLHFDDLLDVQKGDLLSLNPHFFGGEFDVQPGMRKRRLDGCLRLHQVDGQHVFKYVRRIISPREAIDDVRSLIAPLFLDLDVVAIEDMW